MNIQMIVSILMILIACVVAFRKAIRNKRINTALTSDVGRRYLANLEATGQAIRMGSTSELSVLVEDREAIIRDAQSANIDIELVDELIRDVSRRGQYNG